MMLRTVRVSLAGVVSARPLIRVVAPLPKISVRHGVFLAKIAVTVFAFVYLSRLIDPAALIARLRATDPLYLVAALTVALAQIPFVGVRWRLNLAAVSPAGAVVPDAGRIQKITWISQFFSQILPFVVGDAMRVLLLREAGTTLRVAFKSTLLDRGFAVATLFVVASPAILISPVLSAAHDYALPVALFIVAGVVGTGVALLIAPWLWRITQSLPLLNPITDALADMRRIVSDPSHGPWIGLLCLLVHAMSMLVFWLLAHGQRLAVEPGDAAIVVPLIILVTMIPVAVGGWGLREAFLVALLGAAGVDAESALLLSVSFGTVFLIASLPGAIVLALSTRSAPEPAAVGERNV